MIFKFINEWNEYYTKSEQSEVLPSGAEEVNVNFYALRLALG